MIIGIISDTHNNIELTKKAIAIFREKDVEFIVHAGDLTSPKILSLFAEFKCKFVLGNTDIDADYLNMECKKLGFEKIETVCTFTLDNKNFILFHGNDVPIFREAVASGKYNYIIKGHTHFFENYISNNTRIINPGALYGADEFTIATLDTVEDKVKKIKVEED
jgi:uncharacterized protein